MPVVCECLHSRLLCVSGLTMTVILDLSYAVCIWISAAVAITYTLLGGLYSVAYTDVIQLTLLFITSVTLSEFLSNQLSLFRLNATKLTC